MAKEWIWDESDGMPKMICPVCGKKYYLTEKANEELGIFATLIVERCSKCGTRIVGEDE